MVGEIAGQIGSRSIVMAIGSLLGRGHAEASSPIVGESFNHLFTADMVTEVRAKTKGVLSVTFTRVWSRVSFQTFNPLLSTDVVNAINRLPVKWPAADPTPTYVAKQTVRMP